MIIKLEVLQSIQFFLHNRIFLVLTADRARIMEGPGDILFYAGIEAEELVP